MEKERVTSWLKSHHRDRHWLAEQCSVDKRTVDNWLSSPRPIPQKAQVIIESLMAADLQHARELAQTPQNLVLDFTQQEFDLVCDAALKSGQKVQPWAKSRLMELADLDMNAVADSLRVAEAHTEYIFVPARNRYGGPNTIRQPYSAAAGSGTDGDDMGEVRCWGEYPPDHFAIRVIGDSMDDGTENAIPDGCLAVLKPMGDQPYAAKGHIYAWSTPDGTIIKRYNTKPGNGKRLRVLESLHPEFADIHVSEEMIPIGEFVCVDRKPADC